MLDIKEIEISKKRIDTLYRESTIPTEDESEGFVVAKCGQSSALGVVYGGYIHLIRDTIEFQNIQPRDKEQICLLYALQEFDLIVGLGPAGTGKTTLAIAYAMHQLFKKDKRVVLIKPTVFVGGSSNAIAAVPGDSREKLSPYVESFMGPLEKVLGDHMEHHLYELESQKKLIFSALELIRGMDFQDTVVILDEAQNASLHELLSLISRVGEGGTCILLGDLMQIDTEAHWSSCGLYTLVNTEAFTRSYLTAGVTLNKQYRGPLAALAQDILVETFEEEC